MQAISSMLILRSSLALTVGPCCHPRGADDWQSVVAILAGVRGRTLHVGQVVRNNQAGVVILPGLDDRALFERIMLAVTQAMLRSSPTRGADAAAANL